MKREIRDVYVTIWGKIPVSSTSDDDAHSQIADMAYDTMIDLMGASIGVDITSIELQD